MDKVVSTMQDVYHAVWPLLMILNAAGSVLRLYSLMMRQVVGRTMENEAPSFLNCIRRFQHASNTGQTIPINYSEHNLMPPTARPTPTKIKDIGGSTGNGSIGERLSRIAKSVYAQASAAAASNMELPSPIGQPSNNAAAVDGIGRSHGTRSASHGFSLPAHDGLQLAGLPSRVLPLVDGATATPCIGVHTELEVDRESADPESELTLDDLF